ncbi:MAG: hypothetical protein ACKOAR_02410 [Bacteroidota bacterium]
MQQIFDRYNGGAPKVSEGIVNHRIQTICAEIGIINEIELLKKKAHKV